MSNMYALLGKLDAHCRPAELLSEPLSSLVQLAFLIETWAIHKALKA